MVECILAVVFLAEVLDETFLFWMLLATSSCLASPTAVLVDRPCSSSSSRGPSWSSSGYLNVLRKRAAMLSALAGYLKLHCLHHNSNRMEAMDTRGRPGPMTMIVTNNNI